MSLSVTPRSLRPELPTRASGAAKDRGPLVQFARYNGCRLQLFESHTTDLKYYAISHVWGKTQWMRVSCLDREILVSPEKARFIEKQLPGLVQDVPFWMDTLTVDQRNKKEVIATVQFIPAIFRDADKTIAVREHDGIYDCCATAFETSFQYQDLLHALHAHTDDVHRGHIFEESFLQRLWTLQEVLLSHTIRFVVNTQGTPRLLPPSWFVHN
jgi:hypothetical protein